MKIQCPSCQHEGIVPEDKIPAAGVTVNCPKCQTKFQISPPSSSNLDLHTTFDFFCPKCGTGQLVTDSCINCGVVFSDFINLKLHEQPQKEPPTEIGPEMIWKSENESFIFVTCPKCNSESKVLKKITISTINGYSLKDKRTCSCGLVFENIRADFEKLHEKCSSRSDDVELKNNFANSSNKCEYKEHVESVPTVSEAAKGGCGLACGLFVLGCLLMLIPVIGWIAGPLMWIAAFTPFFAVGSAVKGKITGEKISYSTLTGNCPYCNTAITVRNDAYEFGINCHICKKRFIARDKQFFPVK